jgi:hypothetical protein
MTAGAAGHGHLRASHADREYVIDTLKVAFVQGRLTKAEFDQRLSQTLAARTYGALAALTADLPAGLAEADAPRPPAPAPAQPPVSKTLLWAAWVIIALVLGGMVTALVAGPAAAAGFGVLPILIAAPIAGTLTVDSWRGRRPHRQLPPPVPPGQLSASGQDEGIGGGRILCQARPHAAARNGPVPQVVQSAQWSLTICRGGLRSASL